MHSLRFWRQILILTLLALASACAKKPAPAATAAAPAQAPPPPPAAPAHVDLSKLDEGARKVFDQVVANEPSACGKGHSLLHSFEHDSACRPSFYAVRYVARLAATGLGGEEIRQKLGERFRSPRVQAIDLSRAPSKGADSGRVKLVEFADYQCSHCREASKLMPALLAEYPKDVTLYFKHFPLGGNQGSANAALATASAQRQNKFWPFSDEIWARSEPMEPALLEAIAKTIPGLDFDRWYADLRTDEVRFHVRDDRAEARALEIHKTPAIYINGRLFTDEPDLVGLRDWIDEELGR
jgi:hypothetical protein